MKIELAKPDMKYKSDLINICNSVDRSYLSGRMPYPYTEKDAEDWLKLCSEREGKGGLFRIILVDGVAAGDISIEQMSGASRKDAELGYVLLDEFHGKGIMTEAVDMLCKEAFETLDIERITAYSFEPNIGSVRVLEKNGFQYEGAMRKAVLGMDGQFYDLKIYGMLKSDLV
ncbi:MAG: GNAT family N-acetyltransferase [Mogibacterium sp.]|nr:GNAT family N-acetyltransferase [Mogibacterium sp.]